jgi:hypothetical protein
MTALIIVKVEIGVQPLSGLCYRFISLEINFFIFDAFPRPFNNDVVNPSTNVVLVFDEQMNVMVLIN